MGNEIKSQVDAEKNLGDEVVDRETEQGAWQYVETALAAEVHAGDIILRPHWKGAMGSEEIRDVMRLAATAPALYEALNNLDGTFRQHGLASSIYYIDALNQAATALDLVRKPADESAKRPISDHGTDGQAS